MSVSVSKRWRAVLPGLILLAPSLLAVALFVLKPLLDSLLMSLKRIDLLVSLEEGFVGFANYLWLFTREWFLPDLLRSCVITVLTMSGQLLLGLAIALLCDFDFPGKKIVRAVFVAPWAVPVFVAAFIWRWMYSISLSPFNGLFSYLGGEDVSWLGSPRMALFAVIVALIWHGLPFVFLTIYAGLQQVPLALKEAALIDGASAWQSVWHVTLPSIKPVLITVVTLRTIFLFNQFPFIFLLTGGGPLNSTETLAIAAMRQGVNSFNYGRASAITTTMFIILLLLFFLYYQFSLKKGER